MKVREYFTFTKRERNGIVSLLAIMLVIVFAPKYFCTSPPGEPIVMEGSDDAAYLNAVDTTGLRQKNQHDTPANYFRKRAGPGFPTRLKLEPFDINVADTATFIALPGIGSKLAARIVMFREKLGGFYDVKQIGEVYGLQDSVFRKIQPYLRCNPKAIRRLNINTAGKEELKSHPYIRWKIAEALVGYREQHGDFASPADLSKLENIDPDALEKFLPYLEFR